MRRLAIPAAAVLLAAITLLSMPLVAGAVDYGTLTGQLVDSVTGEPIVGVDLMVYEWDGGSTKAMVADGGATDENGRFRAHVRADNAVIYVNGLSQNNQRVYRARFIGEPSLASPLWTNYANPDGSGRWTISLSTGAGDATRYKVAAGKTVDAGRLTVEPTDRSYGYISGRTTEAYSGRGWFTSINIYRFNETTLQWDDMGSYGQSSGRVDNTDAGCFSIVGTAERPLTGRIKVLFAPYAGAGMPNRFFGGTTLEDAQELHIAPGQSVTGLFASIPGLSRVRGRVFDARTGAPVAGAMIEAQRWDPLRRIWRDSGVDFSASNGTYILPDAHGAQAGTWRIMVEAEYAGRWWLMWYGQSSTAAGSTTVEVPENTIVEGIDFALNTASAIVGRALDESGTAESDIMVTAYREGADGDLDYAGSTYTDGTGRYRLPTGVGGRYVVQFRDRAGTTDYRDDTLTYLGANQTAEGAVRLSVATGKARVVREQQVETADDPEAQRTWNGSAQGTALTTSRQTFQAGEATAAVIANGDRWGEALAAAGLAGAVDGPVLLTGRDKLYMPLLGELDRLGVKKIYMVGNSSAIGIRQDRLLRACGYSVERISGADHYDISANIARKIARVSQVTSATPAFVVSGSSRTDAAVVGPAAFALGAPVLYVRASGTPASVRSAVSALGLKRAYLVGSASALPGTSFSGLRSAGANVGSLTRDANGFTRAAQFAEAAFRRRWLRHSAAGLTSYADSAGALGAAAMLGRAGGPLLFGGATQLPSATRAVLDGHSATIGRVHVLADPTDIRTQVVIAAGSR